MPTLTDWFQVYSRIAAADEALGEHLAVVAAYLTDPFADDMFATGSALSDLRDMATANLIPDIHLERLAIEQTAQSVDIIRAYFTDLLQPQVEGLAQSADITRAVLQDLISRDTDRMATALESLSTAGAGVPPSLNEAMTALAGILGQLTEESSPSVMGWLKLFAKGGVEWLPAIAVILQYAPDVIKNFIPQQIRNVILDQVGTAFDDAMTSAQSIAHVLERPFEAIMTEALAEFRTTLTAGGPADPLTAPDRAVNLLLVAHKFGLAAHGIAAAAEMITPLKALGFKEAAAALVDLAGFRPISQAVAQSFIGGSITRPMHYWANAYFMPEIPALRDLQLFVQRRLMDIPTYRGMLQLHGMRPQDQDLFEGAVYREATIRDLALALQDTTTDLNWLTESVKKAGYSDDDADRLARSLQQRAQTSARTRVITSATTLYQNGLLTDEDLTATLKGLQLPDDQIALEIQAARFKQLQDAATDAQATYKKQFINGVIDEGDYRLALSALGLSPGRAAVIVADVIAQKTPKIQREAEAAVKEAEAAIRTNLLPRYKQLYLNNQVTRQQYIDTLTAAGVTPEMAAQIVSLDDLRRGIINPPGITT